jgi:CDP-glucose 4,6-dehydratase
MENMVNMFQLLEQAYKGKKVFLTGHTGFKGAWLLKILDMLGAEIKGYALHPENETDLYNLINGDSLCKSVIADLREKECLKQAIVQFQPDYVFHLAAQPLVRLSYEIPAQTFEVNVIGTVNLLDGVRSLANKCNVIVITTDKVYYNYEWVYPYREEDRLGGYDPYSASKACAELAIDSYRNSFFNLQSYDRHQKAIAVARAGNVIGGGDWAKDRLLPDIARALTAKKGIPIRNPLSVRPWQHVLEPVIAYLLLGANLNLDPRRFSQAYNFGPNATDTLSVSDMVKLAVKAWGEGAFSVSGDVGMLHEAGLLKLDISKAGAELGWKPKMDAKEAVNMTVSWYKTYADGKTGINEFTNEQILHYFQL